MRRVLLCLASAHLSVSTPPCMTASTKDRCGKPILSKYFGITTLHRSWTFKPAKPMCLPIRRIVGVPAENVKQLHHPHDRDAQLDQIPLALTLVPHPLLPRVLVS